ncbi:MAG: tetratricopeptide repeat-containing sensor histidine kinase [Bacteroidales bacterium]|nr:tetratricopeptide repeat-containing sensor histidine kinase [Bacteroidales bacterium]
MNPRITTYIFVFLFCYSYTSVSQVTDSLEIFLQSSYNDTTKINLLNQLCVFYTKIDSQKSFNYGRRAFGLANKLELKRDKAMALENIASTYLFYSVYSKALQYYLLSLNTIKEINDKEQMSGIMNQIGIMYKVHGNYAKSLEYHQKALKINEELKNKKFIVNTLTNIGECYRAKMNHEKALEYLFKSLLIGKVIDDKNEMKRTLNRIGAVYNEQSKYQLALKYLNESLELNRKMKDEEGIATCLNEIGQIYLKQKKFTDASDYLFMSLKIREKLKSQSDISNTLINIAYLNYDLCLYSEAIEYALKSYDIAVKAGVKNHSLFAAQVLSNSYMALNDYENALKFNKLENEIRNEIYNNQISKEIIEIQSKNKIEKKEKGIEILLLKQRYNIIIFISFGIIVISIIIYFRYRIKLKSNKMLSHKNEQIKKVNTELALKNQQISEQNKILEILNREQKELIAIKDRFFSIIAHDLKSPFNIIFGFSNILYKDFEDFDDGQKKEFIKEINNSSEETYKLLENLLDWSRSQSGNIDFNPEVINLNNIIKNTISVLKFQAKIKNISLSLNVPDNIKIFADKNLLRTIFRNLISNAIKFTYENGEVNVSSELKANFVEIKITDNGVGMSEENIKKLFRIDEKFKTNGTANEKGTGLGLVLCREFVEKIGGKIWVESEEGKGSNFYFTIPKMK